MYNSAQQSLLGDALDFASPFVGHQNHVPALKPKDLWAQAMAALLGQRRKEVHGVVPRNATSAPARYEAWRYIEPFGNLGIAAESVDGLPRSFDHHPLFPLISMHDHDASSLSQVAMAVKQWSIAQCDDS
jgi:hypothetical protein